MSESPCRALNNAIREKGGIDYPKVAQSVGTTEDRVRKIVQGTERPTQHEFNVLASSLDITSAPPHDAAHSTK